MTCSSVDPTRRRLLTGAAAAGALALARPAAANIIAPPRVHKRLSLLNVHTGEELRATFWRRGVWDVGALEEMDHLLRDWREEEVRPIDWRVYSVLAEIAERTGQPGPIRVVSGYRTPATNEMLRRTTSGVAKQSYHTRAQAVDLWVYGEPLWRLRRTARAAGAGGVGYYPDSGFIHVDVGPVRDW